MEEDSDVINSDLFQAVDEPEDTMPLPYGYHDYSGFVADSQEF